MDTGQEVFGNPRFRPQLGAGGVQAPGATGQVESASGSMKRLTLTASILNSMISNFPKSLDRTPSPSDPRLGSRRPRLCPTGPSCK
jgi:hypothetical protein